MNYLKIQGQGGGTTGWHNGEKWVMALGQCGKRRHDEEEKKYTSCGELDQPS
jgi:hypothetical protein